MRSSELIFSRLLNKHVKVKASEYIVEGKLLKVEASEHNGFGNLILQTKEGLVLVRGSNVQSIGEVKNG